MTVDVAVVVVTYNSQAVVADLLDSLPAALDGLVADVVVVDNGSSDGTVDVLAERTDCRVVVGTNVGYAAGINRGVSAATGGVPVLVLNPDARLLPTCVPRLLAALERPGVGVVAPRVESPGGRLELSLRREPTLLRALGLSALHRPAFSEYVQEPVDYTRGHVVDWALGAVLLFSRRCFDALGGWDESYFLYSEETAFCLAARDLGLLTWFEPSAVAVHIGGQSGQSANTHAMQIVNRVRLYRRRNGPARSWLYLAATVLSELSWIAREHPQSRVAVRALVQASSRPPELGCSAHLMPR